ncbi:proliferating cell nuclear antigen-like [Bidens hawaiensis]|uniref:proliferating cell nuclear antigen-like n=1 Tax=Bidens hawaiensis TaxID=980011 RepID=UPI00404B3238
MLTCADNHDTVTVKADDGGDSVNFKFDSPDTDFDMKLMDIDDSDHFEIPELGYNAIVQMPSSEFARICKDLSTIADYYVVISVTKEEMKFSTKGDIGTTSIVCKQKTFADKVRIVN